MGQPDSGRIVVSKRFPLLSPFHTMLIHTDKISAKEKLAANRNLKYLKYNRKPFLRNLKWVLKLLIMGLLAIMQGELLFSHNLQMHFTNKE